MRGKGEQGREQGQSTVWAVAVVFAAMTCAVLLSGVVRGADQRSSVQSVADLAALAGVTGGRPAADQVADRNGSAVVGYSEADGVVTLRVRRGDVEADASATGRDDLPPGDGGP